MQNLWNDPNYQRLRSLLEEATIAKARFAKEIIRLEEKEYSRVQDKFRFSAIAKDQKEVKTP